MNHAARIVALVRPYWKRAVLALALLTTLVVLDLSIPRLIQRIIDEGIARGDQRVVIETAVLMLAISAVSTVIAVGNNNLSVQVGESVARDLREAVFRRIMSFTYGNLDRMQTGLLMVRLTSDANAVQRLVQISLRIGTRAPLLMLGSLALMINTSPGLALTILPVLLFASILVVFFVARMEPLFRAVQQKLDQLNTVLQENIAGARVVKAFVRAAHEGRRFEAANEDFTGHSVRVMRFMSTMFPALTLCVNVGVILVIWVGGTQAIQGTLTIGQIVAFTNYLLTTMGPLTMLTMLSNVWASGFASAKRIHEVLDTVPEVQDQPDARDLTGEGPARVVFEDVVFDYGGQAGEPVLAAVDLVAEPGQTVAFLGATGAGKTTLVNLIPRFYDVAAGRVLVDGIDVRAIRQDALLAQVGIVPQESVLFAASVRENIRYGRPDASDEEVVAAAQAAQAHDFIMAMPQGYDTPVAQRGASLSGGQKQRIAIARALLLRPRILILDDATSSVDVETETRIQDALGAQAARHTSFVVAQRISTVLTADKIVVIDRGRVAAQGTHRELLRSSAIYREIYDSQLGNGNGLRPGETTGGDREARP